jgi:hypothetical protein
MEVAMSGSEEVGTTTRLRREAVSEGAGAATGRPIHADLERVRGGCSQQHARQDSFSLNFAKIEVSGVAFDTRQGTVG